MSRILQALKQLEARPADAASAANVPAAVPVAPLPGDVPPTPITSTIPPAATTCGPVVKGAAEAASRPVTERIAPRRIKKQKLRATRKTPLPAPEPVPVAAPSAVVAAPPIERAVVASADEIQALLASLGPGVIEYWEPHPRRAEFEHLAQPPLADTSQQASIIVQDFVPQVIERSAELALPAGDSPPTLARLPEYAIETTTEVELDFAPAAPRRTKRVNQPPKPREREETRAAIEQQVRTVVRGPRELGLAQACAWETTIRADLEDPRTSASLAALLARWKNEHQSDPVRSLLIASLAAPLAAAEIALRAAVMLARDDDGATLIVDADPEAAVTRRFGITGKAGLSELLAPHDAHGETIFPTATPRLHFLPRGRTAWPAGTSAESARRLLAELSQEYRWLLIVAGDAQSAATQTLATVCRGAYVVAPLGRTELATAEQQLAALQQAGARIVGAIASE